MFAFDGRIGRTWLERGEKIDNIKYHIKDGLGTHVSVVMDIIEEIENIHPKA